MVRPKAPEAPLEKGDPATTVKLPVVELMANAVMVLSKEFATYRTWPLGLTTKASGPPPVGNGEPWTSVNAPVTGSMANTLTLAPLALATKRKWPAGSMTQAMGFWELVGNGDPAIGFKAPVFVSSVSAVISSLLTSTA